MARRYEVRLTLDGVKSGAHHTGDVFPVDLANEDVVRAKERLLTFSDAQAQQCQRTRRDGSHFLRMSYAVTKRSVE